MTPQNQPEPQSDERELEALAMNIVYQLGDALYEALPPDIAHKHFVTARQKTNDEAIDFAKQLIEAWGRKQLIAERVRLAKMPLAALPSIFLNDKEVQAELQGGKNEH